MACDLRGGLVLIVAVLQCAVGLQPKGKEIILLFYNGFFKSNSKMGETDALF